MSNPVHAEIIARIEKVREILHHNRSKFCRAFGMKPQTYNNFISSQGSKPNIVLILGVVEKFQVEPLWLLTGRDRNGAAAEWPVWLDRRDPTPHFRSVFSAEKMFEMMGAKAAGIPDTGVEKLWEVNAAPSVAEPQDYVRINRPVALLPGLAEDMARIATALENISEWCSQNWQIGNDLGGRSG